jgi:hypothetical protein
MSNLHGHLNNHSSQNRAGIVLLVTLVVLVVLSTLGYTLTNRVAAQRHRQQYIMDYCKARYGCDSALKYALATLEDLQPELISRPNEPDFSDLFFLSEQEYQDLLSESATDNGIPKKTGSKYFDSYGNTNDIYDSNSDSDADKEELSRFIPIVISGPYGPPWPYVTEPIEFEIGSAKVRIEIEDENAKYPLGWMLLTDKNVQPEVEAGFETFCEWMRLGTNEIDVLKEQLQEISQIKPFRLEFKPISTYVKNDPKEESKSKQSPRKGRTAVQQQRSARLRRSRKTISVADQLARQNADFARLFHSSLIDTEMLARPTIVSESRKESALKYVSRWACTKVNVNTAPRHVLEAAFTFGGLSDAPKIAEGVIQRRRLQPFVDLDDLRRSLLSYSDSIGKCEAYITTTSSFFTIKVTAVSGVAKASAMAAITKEGDKVARIAVVPG